MILYQGNIGLPGAKGESGPQGRPGPEVISVFIAVLCSLVVRLFFVDE